MFTMCGTDMITKLAVKDALPQIQTYILSGLGVVALPPGCRDYTPSVLFHKKTV
jgi:hypothetical protein